MDARVVGEQVAVDAVLPGIALDPVPLGLRADDGQVAPQDEALVHVLEGLDALAGLVHPHAVGAGESLEVAHQELLPQRRAAVFVSKLAVILVGEGIECGEDKAPRAHIGKHGAEDLPDAALPPVLGQGGHVADSAGEDDAPVIEDVVDVVDQVRGHRAVLGKGAPVFRRAVALRALLLDLFHRLFRIHRADKGDGGNPSCLQIFLCGLQLACVHVLRLRTHSVWVSVFFMLPAGRGACQGGKCFNLTSPPFANRNKYVII